jgi:hypothetical protein
MGKCGPGKPNVKAGSRGFQFIHGGDKLQPFVGNEKAKDNPEEIQKPGAMCITPFFDIGNDTHIVD